MEHVLVHRLKLFFLVTSSAQIIRVHWGLGHRWHCSHCFYIKLSIKLIKLKKELLRGFGVLGFWGFDLLPSAHHVLQVRNCRLVRLWLDIPASCTLCMFCRRLGTLLLAPCWWSCVLCSCSMCIGVLRRGGWRPRLRCFGPWGCFCASACRPPLPLLQGSSGGCVRLPLRCFGPSGCPRSIVGLPLFLLLRGPSCGRVPLALRAPVSIAWHQGWLGIP